MPTTGALAHELSTRFGGMTAFNRAPAKGPFEHGAKSVEDDIIVFEVMVDALDREWWQALKTRLELDFELCFGVQILDAD